MKTLHALSLDWLKTFVVFCESPNVYVAAERLGLSQPAVTQHLQRLEQSLSTSLFWVDGKKKIPSVAGKRLYEEASLRLSDLEESLRGFLSLRDDLSACRLKVGVRRELFAQVIDVLRFPGTLELLPMSAPEAHEALLSNKVDCAFVHQRPEGARWLSFPLISNRAVLLIDKKLPLRGAPTLEWVRAHSSFLYREDATLMKPWVESLGGTVRDLKVKLICSDWDILVRSMHNHPGFAVIPSDIETDSKVFRRIELPENLVSPVKFYAAFPASLRSHPGFAKYFSGFSRN